MFNVINPIWDRNNPMLTKTFPAVKAQPKRLQKHGEDSTSRSKEQQKIRTEGQASFDLINSWFKGKNRPKYINTKAEFFPSI